MTNKTLIEKNIETDKEIPVVLKGITIQDCNESNLISNKFVKSKDAPGSHIPVEMNYYKPISKCYKTPN